MQIFKSKERVAFQNLINNSIFILLYIIKIRNHPY